MSTHSFLVHLNRLVSTSLPVRGLLQCYMACIQLCTDSDCIHQLVHTEYQLIFIRHNLLPTALLRQSKVISDGRVFHDSILRPSHLLHLQFLVGTYAFSTFQLSDAVLLLAKLLGDVSRNPLPHGNPFPYITEY